MSTNGYFPRKLADILAWCIAYFAMMTEANVTRWGLNSTQIVTLRNLFEFWRTLYEKCASKETATAPLRIERDEKTKELEKELRTFNQANLIHNPNVTNSDREALGLTVPHGPTPGHAPRSTVDFTVEASGPGELIVRFRDHNEKGHARPADAEEAVIVYAILDHAPADPKELTEWVTDSRTPCNLKFNGSDRGKSVYIAMCWKNKHGMGSWSEIQHAIIP
jgi:hypothetical protein